MKYTNNEVHGEDVMMRVIVLLFRAQHEGRVTRLQIFLDDDDDDDDDKSLMMVYRVCACIRMCIYLFAEIYSGRSFVLNCLR